jgi:DNA-binding GntR family transcriptional regulator
MRSPKKEILYDAILNRLITAHYRFGDRILVKELVEQTGASRQPIMTALSALSADGFVQIIPQVGCEVVSPEASDIADFFQMFGRLEGLLAELAAARRKDAQVAALEAVNLKIRKLSRKDRRAEMEYRDLNQAFHRTVHQMANSPLLNARQATLFAMSDFFIMQTVGFGAHLAEAADEHEAVVSAIARRRPESARTAAEEHIKAVSKTVLDYLEADRDRASVAKQG